MASISVRWLNGEITPYPHYETVRELQFAICNNIDCCVHEVIILTADTSTPFGIRDPAPCPISVSVIINRDHSSADATPMTWEELLNEHKDNRIALRRMCEQKIPPNTDLIPYFADKCRHEHVIAVTVLLELFPHEGAFDLTGAFTEAVHHVRNRTVCTLLEVAGDRIHIADRNHFFVRSVIRNAPTVAHALLKHNADPTAHNGALLPLICTYARPDMALEYVSLLESLMTNPQYGLDINARNRDGDSALILAIANFLPPVAHCLLDRKADATLANDRGMTALHMATLVGNSDMVSLLVRHGADVNAKDGRGVSVTDVAVDRQEKKIIKQLVALGAQAPKRKKWPW
eukprot:GEMP01041859.1.p1 GENE.GEMP01041859.1~~GEMP01041859.1.p1  ORF type:complete len:355 (+),score=88.98 GEMP01041859.1:30-1067(+)